jgi:hypothetical protein
MYARNALAAANAHRRHGEWLGWLAENFTGSERSAHGYMRLASNTQRAADLESGQSLRDALKALCKTSREPTPDRGRTARTRGTQVGAQTRVEAYSNGSRRLSVMIARGAALPVVVVAGAALPVIAVAGAALLPVIAVARATPVRLVVRITVAVEIVVATAPVPVVTPAGIPPLTGAPVISRRRSDGLCLGDCRRPQTGESQTAGQYER